MLTDITNKSTVTEIRERFDNDVERFSNLETGQQTTIDAPLSLELITEAAKYITPNATSVLDIGCGAGNYTLKMLTKVPGMNATLIDLSKPMLDKAAERVTEVTKGKVETIQGDIREIELQPESFDIILAGAVLHHLREDKEWEAVFKKLFNALRPGGSFWISDLIVHESKAITDLFWDKYSEYLKGLGGEVFQKKIFDYIDKEDSPRSVNFQIDLMKKTGFRYTEILHKNSCFAAFGAIK